MKLQRNSRTYKIMKYVLVGGGILMLSFIAPGASAKIIKGIIDDYSRKKKFQREKFVRDLKRLKERQLINYQELADGRIRITLTKRGKKESLVYNLDTITLNTQRWDGKWRLVIFDIPHPKKRAREALRAKLKMLGFYPIQKSVFLTPYECEKEIDFICSVFEIREHVLILYISKFEGEEKFKNHFNLS